VEPLDLPGRVEALVQETNRRVHRFREGLSLVEPMGTTLTALVWAGKDRHVFQVGDSRAYRASNEEYVQQSRDHVLASPTASSIPGGVTNAIDGGTLHVDVTTLAAASPVERWLLSSDGFWSPAHALNVLPRPPESAGRDPVQLLDLVRRGEAERLDLLRDADNATVVLVELQHPGNVSEEAS
jgi:PPM family protein phosphatase